MFDYIKKINSSTLGVLWCMTLFSIISFKLCKFNFGHCPKKGRLMEMLPNDLKTVYKDIKKNRKMISRISVIVALVISSVYVIFVRRNKDMFVSFIEIIGLGGLLTSIIYSLMPKKDWLILHLDDKNQRKEWVDNYKRFSDLSTYGMLFGLMRYLIFV